MHCPKCGDVLSEERTTFYCCKGDMEFSITLDRAFRRYFLEKLETAPDTRWSCRVGGEWFCPQCGRRMQEKDGRILCDSCHLNLAGLIYTLIEHHPHRTESGGCI